MKLLSFLAALLCASLAVAQSPQPLAITTPQNQPQPTWETQKQARTYFLNIPAPRGQITDRTGEPLAVNRLAYNLAISFPPPLGPADARAVAYAKRQIEIAQQLLKREIQIPDAAILKYYENRAALPMDIVQDLKPDEVNRLRGTLPPGLVLRPLYLRYYPTGLAGHVIGYAGRKGKQAEGPIQNSDSLWPEAEGREGIEETFNQQLTGKPGQINVTFSQTGERTSEKIAVPPEPGYNVVTTLDAKLQALAEKILSKGTKRGALVVLDPNNGDVLALASWPSYDPNLFVPTISQEEFDKLQNDPDIPLLPRAFRSAYPPGSTFKVVVGAAALQSHIIRPEDEFGCPSAFQVGNVVFHNWRRSDGGSLNFVEALTQSCNTWFYQVGLKLGSERLIDWSLKFGLGSKTGIPVRSEAEGRIPNNEYMQKVYGRRILQGDLANYSIGQGDILISPLQMAQLMGAIANGGTLYQTRLVQQVQTLNNKIVTAYQVRARDLLELNPKAVAELHKAMTSVVNGAGGTAHTAAVRGMKAAGKTGTAQWGPKSKERTAAWFAGFAPVEKPKYTFAVVYEGAPGRSEVHGGTHAAPMIGKLLAELVKDEKPKEKSKTPTKKEEEEMVPPKGVEPDRSN